MEELKEQAERIMVNAMPATAGELRQALINAEIGIFTHKRAQEEFVAPFLSATVVKQAVTVESMA